MICGHGRLLKECECQKKCSGGYCYHNQAEQSTAAAIGPGVLRLPNSTIIKGGPEPTR